MAKSIIPKDLYVGFQIRQASNSKPSADGGKHVALGFLTYRNEKGKLQHQESFDKWRDNDIPRIPLDNTPTTGMIAIGYVDRYSTSNKLIRIEDPRNFQVEITVENFIDIIKQVTLVNGAIQDEMAWGWNNGLRLFKVGTDDYLESKANFEFGENPTIPVKSVGLGSEVMLANGKRGLYYGGWHVVQDDWGDNCEGYFGPGKKGEIKTKRYHFLKIDDKFEKWSSIQIKHIFEEQNYDKESVYLELKYEVNKTIKYKIVEGRANKVISDNNYSDRWKYKNEINEVYTQFGLTEGGYNLIDEDRRYSSDPFYFVYAISEKPIKQDVFEELMEIEKVKYETMHPMS